jgi:hypothetical protein
MTRSCFALHLFLIFYCCSFAQGDTLPDKLTPTYKKVTKKFDRKYNDISRYLAGMKPEKGCVLDTHLLNSREWKNYSDTIELSWYRYDTARYIVLKEWAYDELQELNTKRFTFFYPFSGPDVLHGNMFFPNADTTIMIGLEAVGNIPFLGFTPKDSLYKYFGTINNSLYAVLNYSFFRTLSMRKDLTAAQVGGTLPLLLILLERTHNRVLNVRGVHLDKSGNFVFDDLMTRKKVKSPGVEITYCREDSTHESKLYYFSVDLSNSGFYNKNPEFLTFLKKMGMVSTLLKSASYLMYTPDFTMIRSLILNQSSIILQDDSGIPHHFFSTGSWNHTLYGTYTGTIPLFAGKYQPGLVAEYKKNKEKVKPLRFGIGYKYHVGESNLVLYRKEKK